MRDGVCSQRQEMLKVSKRAGAATWLEALLAKTFSELPSVQ